MAHINKSSKINHFLVNLYPLKIRKFVFYFLIGLILFGIILFLIGCKTNNKAEKGELIFKGESLNWKARLVYAYSYKGFTVQKELFLYYKGPEEKITDVSYKMVESMGRSTTSQTGFSIKKGVWESISKSGAKGVALTKKEDFFTLEIKWNNKEETAILKVEGE